MKLNIRKACAQKRNTCNRFLNGLKTNATGWREIPVHIIAYILKLCVYLVFVPELCLLLTGVVVIKSPLLYMVTCVLLCITLILILFPKNMRQFFYESSMLPYWQLEKDERAEWKKNNPDEAQASPFYDKDEAGTDFTHIVLIALLLVIAYCVRSLYVCGVIPAIGRWIAAYWVWLVIGIVAVIGLIIMIPRWVDAYQEKMRIKKLCNEVLADWENLKNHQTRMKELAKVGYRKLTKRMQQKLITAPEVLLAHFNPKDLPQEALNARDEHETVMQGQREKAEADYQHQVKQDFLVGKISSVKPEHHATFYRHFSYEDRMKFWENLQVPSITWSALKKQATYNVAAINFHIAFLLTAWSAEMDDRILRIIWNKIDAYKNTLSGYHFEPLNKLAEKITVPDKHSLEISQVAESTA